VERVERGASGPVTLLLAPAGWGKTAVLSTWARAERDGPAPAWVTVGEGDTARRLWGYLAAALRTAAVDDPDEGPPPPVPDGPPRPEQLESLAAAPAPPEPPAHQVRQDPELALAAAAERAYAGDPAAADGQLRRALAHADDLPAPRRDRFRRLAAAVELSLARLGGNHQGVREAADRLLATASG
ncbi:hypothetical protein KBX39_32610, partial [Micromonospora sp. D75]|nr:hypothetical protein [Micromonospora sp. D75]